VDRADFCKLVEERDRQIAALTQSLTHFQQRFSVPETVPFSSPAIITMIPSPPSSQPSYRRRIPLTKPASLTYRELIRLRRRFQFGSLHSDFNNELKSAIVGIVSEGARCRQHRRHQAASIVTRLDARCMDALRLPHRSSVYEAPRRPDTLVSKLQRLRVQNVVDRFRR
jgi:hypothetical protein